MGDDGGVIVPGYTPGTLCEQLLEEYDWGSASPLFIDIKFNGILLCPEDLCQDIGPAPNGYVFTAMNSNYHPCRWVGNHFLWQAVFDVNIDGLGHSGLMLFEMSYGVFYFFALSSSPGQRSWNNSIGCDVNICGYGGTGVIF
jgi:hypothetical protein